MKHKFPIKYKDWNINLYEIKQLKLSGEKQINIAKIYNCSPSLISQILSK